MIANVTGTAGADLFGATSPIVTDETYDPADSTINMASGAVAAHFSRLVRIFDAPGTGHDMRAGFLKADTNDWAVEVFAKPESDVSMSSPLVDGRVATGTLQFNGDATLANVSGDIADPVTINWTNGTSPTTISFDWARRVVPTT